MASPLSIIYVIVVCDIPRSYYCCFQTPYAGSRYHDDRHDDDEKILFYYIELAASAATRGASPQKHGYVRYMPMFVAWFDSQIYILRYINKPRLVSKLFFLKLFLIFFHGISK
jgi:hypothetical protein